MPRTPAPEQLAIDGGTPIRGKLLPYGRQSIDEDDIAAVVEVLRGDWLTTGPTVVAFEQALAKRAGAKHGIAFCNGTAALHACMGALGVGPGDEVLVPALTFVATANAVVFQGATPVFVDVDERTLLMDPRDAARKVTPRTKAIVPVDFAGQPCDYPGLRRLAAKHRLKIVADACHALGGRQQDRPVGSLADLTAFSFHPVKHITTGEGGLVTTDDDEIARRLRLFRNHGIATDHRERSLAGTWDYDMVELGHNLRLTDIQAALGLSQLRKLDAWLERRNAIASAFDQAFAKIPGVSVLPRVAGDRNAYHLYVLQVDGARFTKGRDGWYAALRAEGIGVNVHYKPVHLHPFYRNRFGTGPGTLPHAEAAFQRILSLPMFPAMTDADVQDVVRAVRKVAAAYARA